MPRRIRHHPHVIAILLAAVVLRQAAGATPDVVDLREFQTPIRNQGGRGSCTYHPPIAALEAAYKRQGIDVDLSVEHLIWLRNVTALNAVKSASINECNLASLTGGGVEHNLKILQRYGVCLLSEMPYHREGKYEDGTSNFYTGFQVAGYKWSAPFRQRSLNEWNMDPAQFPDAARRGARYGVKSYAALNDRDRKNPAKIEEILAAGHEVTIGMGLHDDRRSPADRVADPIWRMRAGDKMREGDGHAMLIVGYERRRRFFIVKNSWGPTRYDAAKLKNGWKDIVKYNGYTLIDYNCLVNNGEACYIKETVNPKSDRYRLQRLLGQWRVEFKHGSRKVAAGVLVWRRLPHTAFWLKEGKDLRIGDFVDAVTKKEYRVNALFGKGNHVSLYIDFARANMGITETRGMRMTATLQTPHTGPATLSVTQLNPPPGQPRLFGVPAGEIALHATQLAANPLLELRTGPKREVPWF